MVSIIRKSNLFERVLLVIGILVVIGGIFLVTRISALSADSGLMIIIAAVLWLILILLLIVAAIAENAREDLAIIVSENSQELKLLRKLTEEQLEQIKLLRTVKK